MTNSRQEKPSIFRKIKNFMLYPLVDGTKFIIPEQTIGDGIISWDGIPIAQGDGAGHLKVVGRFFDFWTPESNLQLLQAGYVADNHYSGMSQFFIGPDRCVAITDAHLYHQLFNSAATENLLERSKALEGNFAVALGDNNTFSSPRLKIDNGINETWSKLRKAIANAVHRAKLNESSAGSIPDVIQKVTQEVILNLENDLKHSNGELTDLESFCMKITMSVTVKKFMGVPMKDKAFVNSVDKIAALFTELLREAMNQKNSAFWLLRPSKLSCIKTQTEKKKAKLMQAIRELFVEPYRDHILNTDNVISEIATLDPLNKGKEPKDFILDSEFMLNQIGMLLMLGHDTTARAIQFMLMHLADDPDLQTKIMVEIENNYPRDGLWTRDLTCQLPILNAVFKETERLYPGAPFLGYGVMGDLPIKTELLDLSLPKGSFIFFSLFTAQRSEKYFKNPNQFDYTRFMPKEEKEDLFDIRSKPNSKTPFFSPFGYGKRQCVAPDFAQFEAIVAVIHFLERFQFRKKNPHADVALDLVGTLRPKDVISLELQERAKSVLIPCI